MAVDDTGAIKASLKPKVKDLGEFKVRRALPFISHRSVGPWVFFDHFGPVDFEPGGGMNVRPHPHIGLATVTYLFDGEIFHRDSLGNELPIRPGAMNLMVAGKGVTHSERTRDELRAKGFKLHGLQLWHALPEDEEEREPSFHHYTADEIPEVTLGAGVTVRIIMGSAFGETSPVQTFSDILYFEAHMKAGSSLTLPSSPERAIYVVDGTVSVDGQASDQFTMSILSDGACEVRAEQDARFALIGGGPLGPRHIKWNFVSSSRDRIARAEKDWIEGRFPRVINDEEEFIPLPNGDS